MESRPHKILVRLMPEELRTVDFSRCLNIEDLNKMTDEMERRSLVVKGSNRGFSSKMFVK